MRSPSWFDGEPEPAPDLLALAVGGARLVERADLEHVGVVPAFAQRRVAEDEPQRLSRRQEPLLVAHDEVVRVDVGGAVAPRVLGPLLVVDAEVAVVDLLDGRKVESGVSGLRRKLRVRLLEPLADRARASDCRPRRTAR